MLHIGLIGCGRIAEKHVRTIAQLDHVSLAALSDIHRINMQEIESLYQKASGRRVLIPCYENYRELLKDPSIDIVVIAVYSGMHAAIAQEAIKQNKHVIIEKPLALSLQDAETIIHLAAVYRKKALVCHQLRYRPLLQKVKAFLDAGYFGPLFFGMVSLRLNRSRDYYESSCWKGTWEKDGGMLLNQGIHLVDLLVWLMGDVKSVYGEMATYVEGKATEDVAAGVVTFKNHAKGLIEANTITQPENVGYQLAIFGRNGTVCIGGKAFDELNHCYIDGLPDAKDELLQIAGQSTEHVAMYEDFLQAIQSDRPYLMTAKEGKRALETIFALYRSDNIREPVTLSLSDFST